MQKTIIYLSITIFSIFVGSQITEGCLLIPYWKTLSMPEFYEYYSQFGPTIGRFYTVLTIIAASIPLSFSIYCFYKKSQTLKHSIISSLFACAFIASFYLYFKETNQQFYEAAFNAIQLVTVLKVYCNWHWFRVFLEVVSLIFLLLTLRKFDCKNGQSNDIYKTQKI